MQSLTLSTQLIQQVVDLARRAGEAIMEIYNQADVGTVYKEDNSPLTQADLVSHRLIVGELTKLTPDLPVLSEESARSPTRSAGAGRASGWSTRSTAPKNSSSATANLPSTSL